MSKSKKKTSVLQNVIDKLNQLSGGKATLVLSAAIVVVVVLVIIIAVASGNPLYGTYKTGDLLYLSPLSFDHKTLYEENYESITLSKKAFSYLYEEKTTTFEKPEYETVEVTEELLSTLRGALQNKEEISFEGAQKVHYITTKEATSDRYMLVEFEDTMWYVVYHLVGERMSIWHIFEMD